MLRLNVSNNLTLPDVEQKNCLGTDIKSVSFQVILK